MTVTFPATLDDFTAIPSGGTQDVEYGGRTHGQFHTDEGAAIEALQAKLGISESSAQDTPLANRVLLSLTNDKSKWGQITASMITPGATVLRIAEVTLAAPAATIDFTSIPQTYRSLHLELSSINSAGPQSIVMRLSADGTTFDTGTNYDSQRLAANNTTPSAAQAFGGTTLLVGRHGFASTVMSALMIDFIDYANTSYQKPILAFSADKEGTSSGSIVLDYFAGFWRNTAGVNGIRLIPGADSFGVGSRATLWGKP